MPDPTFHPNFTDLPVAIKRADGNLGLANALLTPADALRLMEWLREQFFTEGET